MNKICEEEEEEEEEEEMRGTETNKSKQNRERETNEKKKDEEEEEEEEKGENEIAKRETEKTKEEMGDSEETYDHHHHHHHHRHHQQQQQQNDKESLNNHHHHHHDHHHHDPQQQQQQTVLSKDPMRDSLMSNSDEGEEGGFSDDEDEAATNKGHENENSLDLDLEFDLWEGQFEISRPRYPPSYGYFKDIVKTVQMLQQQVGVLAENQSNTDDRFSRVRQDNAAYQERVVMLEEQLREAEHRYEERRAEEQRRNRELLTRVEREKQLTVENFTIKLASLEKDKTALEEELRRTKALLEKLQKEKESLEDRVSEAEFTASALHQENAKMVEQGRRRDDEGKVERERSAQVIEELRCEIERLRAAEEAERKRAPSVDASSSPPPELQATLKRLREENKGLVEQVEDLQAQLLTSHLEEGRTLVTATNNNSLAAEFEAMTSEELKKSLKDSQEANQHLRAYIDGILLNIVENYPQLLEVKQPK